MSYLYALFSLASNVKTLLTLLIASMGGFLAKLINIPLPWVLGPMFIVAACNLLGYPSRQPALGRRAGQMTIGIALGLYFTSNVFVELASLLVWLLLGAAFSILLTIIFARFFQGLTGANAMTATYACAIGGASDMATQAQRFGADPITVAIAHAVRVMIVVTVIPFVVASHVVESASVSNSVQLLGLFETASGNALELGKIDALSLIVIFFVSVVVTNLVKKIPVPNPWVLTPLCVAAAYALSGNEVRLPESVVNAGSILIGWNLGQHATRDFIGSSARVLTTAFLVTVGMLLSSLGFAFLVAWGTGIELISAAVATSPGGIAEMAITAKVMGIGTPTVTAFHLTRMLVVIIVIKTLADWLVKVRWLK